MPGRLKADAWCPVCGRSIYLLFRTTSRARTVLEFEHEGYKYPHQISGDHATMDRIHARLHGESLEVGP